MEDRTTGSAAGRPPGEWFKSGRSGGGSDCVEVCYLPGGGVAVRNSKRPDAGTLYFTDSEFGAWVGGAKDGASTGRSTPILEQEGAGAGVRCQHPRRRKWR